jgi:hypothetical protein
MTIDERFDAKVDRAGGPDACWLWTAYRLASGYGTINIGGRKVLAHRFSLQRELGRPLVRGEHALHRCDNPPCCNPAHLFAGSAADNAADMVAKDRSADRRGERSGAAKLTELDAVAIRAAYVAGGVTQRELGARYGVHEETIRGIVTGKNWSHV